MPANYFYGPQAEQFAFYRIPKALFTDPAYRGISTDAKVLYGLLLDRMGLSGRAGPGVHRVYGGGNHGKSRLRQQEGRRPSA